MSDIEARFRVRLEGRDELENWFKRNELSARQFSANWSVSMAAVSKSLQQTAGDLGRYSLAAGKALTSASGLRLGLADQARSVLEFRDAVTKLATTAGIAESSIGGLKNQILNVSVATGNMKESVTDALQAFVAKTGDIETARRNLELYAKTATGTGAALTEVSLIGAELSAKMGIGDQRRALGILAKQGDIGAIEFKDLAVRGPQLFAAAAGAGFRGDEGVRKIGGLAQLFAEGVGGSGAAARVATSVEALMRDVSRKVGQRRLGDLGVEVGNRDAIEIAKDVIVKLHGNDRAIQKTGIFTAQAMRGVMTMTRDYREHGDFTELARFTNSGGGDTIIDEKFARNMKTGKSALNVTQARIDRAFDLNAGDSIEGLARGSGGLAGAYEWATSHPGTVLAGGAAALFARHAAANMFGLGMGGGAGGAGAVTQSSGAMGGFGAFNSAAAGAARSATGLSVAFQNSSLLMGVAAAAFAAGKWLDNKYGLSDKAATHMRELTGEGQLDRFTEGAGVEINRVQLQGKSQAVKRRTLQLMREGGNGFGRALYLAEHADTKGFSMVPNLDPTLSSPYRDTTGGTGTVENTINIVINGDDVSADSTGTRKPEVKFRRGGTQ